LARRTDRSISVVRGIARSVVGRAASRVGRSVKRSVRIVISRGGASRVRSVRIVVSWGVASRVRSIRRSVGWAVVWSVRRIAWAIVRSIVWSVVYRVRRVGRGVSVRVGVSRIVWCWRRGSGSWRESRNTTSVERRIEHRGETLFKSTLSNNTRAETRTNSNATILGVQADNGRTSSVSTERETTSNVGIVTHQLTERLASTIGAAVRGTVVIGLLFNLLQKRKPKSGACALWELRVLRA
jgi:hypothetical protein